MRLLVPYMALIVAVVLSAVAVRAVIARAASRFPFAVRPLASLESLAGLGCAMGVFAIVIGAAVIYPQSVLGVYARSPESVEISAIVAAIGAAFVHAFHRRAAPSGT